MTIFVKGIVEKIRVKSKEIRGPKVGVPENILKSFAKSHNISEKKLFKKKIKKGVFYFIKTEEKNILVEDLLVSILPKAISQLVGKIIYGQQIISCGAGPRSIFAIFNRKNTFQISSLRVDRQYY